MELVIKRLGSRWWLGSEDGRVSVRGFPTKKAAAAAKRMVDARSCNPQDARIVIEADAKSFQRSQGMRNTDQEALQHAVEFFAIQFSFNLGLPFPEAKVFFAQYRRQVEEKRPQGIA